MKRIRRVPRGGLMLAVVLVLVGCWTQLAGCGTESTSSGVGGAGAVGATGSGGATNCANETTCGDAQSGCTACAEAGPCAQDYYRCEMSMDCLSYGQCIEPCAEGDTECVADCQNKFPNGGSLYARLLTCVICDQCSAACNGPASGCSN